MRVSDIPEIARLTIPEKILLLEELWDSIASEESNVPVPQSHAANRISQTPARFFIPLSFTTNWLLTISRDSMPSVQAVS